MSFTRFRASPAEVTAGAGFRCTGKLFHGASRLDRPGAASPDEPLPTEQTL